MKIFVRRNDENVEKNKTRTEKPLPTLEIFAIPEEEGADWIPLASLWKTKSGKGYSGQFREYATLNIDTEKYTAETAKYKKSTLSSPVSDYPNETHNPTF